METKTRPSETPFLIETFIPGLGPRGSAEADTPENAFCAVETLLRECETRHAYARVTNDGTYVWEGTRRDILRGTRSL